MNERMPTVANERVLDIAGTSPITAIIQDLRRRNVSASASFSSSAGNLSSTATDPWEEMDAAGGCGPWGKDPSPLTTTTDISMAVECKCRTMRRRMSSVAAGAGAGDTPWKSPARTSSTSLGNASEHTRTTGRYDTSTPVAATSNVCAFCAKKRSAFKTFAWSEASRPTGSDTNANASGNNSGSGMASTHKTQISDEPQHMEALLQSTPQLRFLSPASMDMQGSGKVNANNIVTFVIHAAVEGTAHFKEGFIDSSSSAAASASNGGGGGGAGGHSEYQASLWRDQANHLAASELTSLLWVLAHEMSLEHFGMVENQVFTAVFAMVHSAEKELRMAGIAALDALIVAPSADEERKAIKFANTLSNGLRTAKGDFEFLSAVSKALGHMAKRTANVDFVESEVTRGLEWLQTERSDRRLASCLVLKEIATYVPTTFHSKTSRSTLGQGGSNGFLDHIFSAIRDPQPIVRVCAVDALSQCLKILVERQHSSLTGFLCQIHFSVMEDLQEDTTKKRPWQAIQSAEASQHGSLLVVSTMIAYTRDFMLPRFEEVCRGVLAHTFNSRALIRLEVVRLIPRLARRYPQGFGRRYLEESLTFLMHSASTPPGPRVAVDLRPTAFSALGQLVLAMTDETTGVVIGGSNLPTIKITDDPTGQGHIVELSTSGAIYRNLAAIFDLVRRGLRVQLHSKSPEMSTVQPALHCAASLVEALGDLALPYISNLIDDMFRAGLSNDLILCLQAMAECVPAMQNEIEDRMLQAISVCLAGRPDVTVASLKASVLNKRLHVIQRSSSDRLSRSVSGRVQSFSDAGTEISTAVIDMSDDVKTVKTLVLGLETLASFGGTMCRVTTTDGVIPLLPFVQDVAACYLLHPSDIVRKAAALTCLALLIPPGETRVDGFTGMIVEEVLQELLQVAASDPSPTVRLCVVRALTSRYDVYLCQSHHLQSLFQLLQDEALATRAASLRLIGRLATMNPGPILPVLRRLLNELIVELECGVGTGRMREEATRLLSVFLQAAPLQRLVNPVLHTLVAALPLDKSAPPRLASASLEALGELAQVSGKVLQPWVRDVIPHVLGIMEDRSSASKQRTSLRTLGQIAGSTGYVILPYIDYPELLIDATAILPATKRAPWSLRREVIRTLGILGALDPDRYHEVASKTRLGGAVGGAYFEVDMNEDLRGTDGYQTWENAPVLQSTARRHQSITRTSNQKRRSASRSLSKGSSVELRDDEDNEPAFLIMYEQYAMVAQPVSSLPPEKRMTPQDEEFYPTVAVQALMKIFRDSSLAVHHTAVIQAVMFIFKSLGLRCVPYLGKVVPPIIFALRSSSPSNLRESLLMQLATLSSVVREHLRPYVADIFEVAEQLWSSHHLSTTFSLVSNLAFGNPDEFRRFVPRLIVLLLRTFDELQVAEWSLTADEKHSISGKGRAAPQKLGIVLKSICNLKGLLGDYLRIIVPALLKQAEFLATLSFTGESRLPDSILAELAVQVYRTIATLLDGPSSPASQEVSIFYADGRSGSKQTSENGLPTRVVQPLVRTLLELPPKNVLVGVAIIETLCVCMSKVGVFLWMQLYDMVVKDAICKWQDSLPSPAQGASSSFFPAEERLITFLDFYERSIEDLLSPDAGSRPTSSKRGKSFGSREGLPFAASDYLFENTTDSFDQTMPLGAPPSVSGANRLKVNQGKLQRAWDVSQRASKDDWDEWMRRLGIQLLREAPSPALHACASLAHAYLPLARELFCAAFACCWKELSEPYRVNLVSSLKIAFVADVSPEILQVLLNLAEFMEQDASGGLPIEITVLADLALKCRAYAKALHYREREYSVSVTSACVESLISINGRLDLPEAALGVLKETSIGDSEATSLSASDEGSADAFRHQASEMHYSVTWSTKNKAAVRIGPVDLLSKEELWLAKLGAWTEALVAFEEKLKGNPDDFDAIVGCMRCLISNGEWRKVLELADNNADTIFGGSKPNAVQLSAEANSLSQRKAVRMCAQAAWRLGQWDELERYATHIVGHGENANTAPIARSTLSEGSLPLVDFDGAFYSAVLHIHRKEWNDAANLIDSARRAMDGRLTALMAESYSRAYPSMVTAQTLAEMEEIVNYRKTEERAQASAMRHPTNRHSAEEARKDLLSVWRKRLSGCRLDAEVHASILAVRSLVLGPDDEVESTLLLSELSRQGQRYKFAERVLLDPLDALQADLNGLTFGFHGSEQLQVRVDFSNTSSSSLPGVIDRIVTGDLVSIVPTYGSTHQRWSQSLVEGAGGIDSLLVQYRLYFTLVRHMWHTERKEEAMSRLTHLSDIVDMVYSCENVTDTSLRVKCWLELGEWKLWRADSPGSSFISEHLQADVLTSFKRAILLDNCGYKAWHVWALLNFRIAVQISDLNDADGSKGRYSQRTVRNHAVAAVKGFVNAINVGTKKWCASVQQDLLNLLTCLFKFGNVQDVASELNSSISSVAIEAWLGVLPQLLARIHIKDPASRAVLYPLLTRLGEKHPQALMYPLSVLIKSPVLERKYAAEGLMHSLKNHSSELVEEALMVSTELIRVAILWLETWHEGLDEASRLYFQEGNVTGMLELLIPMHEQLERGAETDREVEFLNSFGEDLEAAHNHLKDYVKLISGNGAAPSTPLAPAADLRNEEAEAAMNRAWDLYYTVFRQINKQLPALTKFELTQCSRALSRARGLELGVPGSYRVDGSYVNIEKFISNVEIITSKQRPRKITLRGSDGKDYVFLLKAHEDLRQDERVMQMFGMVNALLLRDPQTRKHDLKIQRYAISPLSHSCGVVGWVPHCDTLHILIKDYRALKKVTLNMENREMLRIAPDYDLLTTMQKVEVFVEALKKTTGEGNDLYEILWLKSTSSEQWLERRTKFTRSLAVMSMVGYILGLGDRHPSNLMLDKLSGRVLHIDFGDCFEVAMHRDKVPETVPFRLTRMLVKAMEVAGIEGTYRSTCEKTMSVLRESRDSLMAMLEAFVYDPLISWRLADLSRRSNDTGSSSAALSGQLAIAEPPSPRKSRSLSSTGRLAVSFPISELPDEDDDDDDNRPSSLEHSGDRLVHASSRATATTVADRNLALSRSQMYSNMQALVANISVDSRIASITALDRPNDQAAVESSLGRSRMGRSMRQREIISLLSGEEGAAHEEALNEKALKVIRRVENKLIGTEFPDCDGRPLDVAEQVQRLIIQATSTENLCQLYIGWCSFW